MSFLLSNSRLYPIKKYVILYNTNYELPFVSADNFSPEWRALVATRNISYEDYTSESLGNQLNIWHTPEGNTVRSIIGLFKTKKYNIKRGTGWHREDVPSTWLSQINVLWNSELGKVTGDPEPFYANKNAEIIEFMRTHEYSPGRLEFGRWYDFKAMKRDCKGDNELYVAMLRFLKKADPQFPLILENVQKLGTLPTFNAKGVKYSEDDPAFKAGKRNGEYDKRMGLERPDPMVRGKEAYVCKSRNMGKSNNKFEEFQAAFVAGYNVGYRNAAVDVYDDDDKKNKFFKQLQGIKWYFTAYIASNINGRWFIISEHIPISRSIFFELPVAPPDLVIRANNYYRANNLASLRHDGTKTHQIKDLESLIKST